MEAGRLIYRKSQVTIFRHILTRSQGLVFLDLAIRIFGEENEILLKKYVECIFSKYDEDHSGDLDYEGLLRDFPFSKNI